jgi:environmental stress-induced protein Ves
MKLVSKEFQKVSKWTGGTTTELLIFPANAEVSKQNFDYRISTAHVLVEKSEFTSFPSFNRKLAILEGKLKIQHNQSKWYELGVGEQSEFKGDWETRSEGQVVDFNVIYSDKYQTSIFWLTQLKEDDFNNGKEVVGIYCLNGTIQINDILLEKGDFINANGEVVSVVTSVDALCVKVIIDKLQR